MTDKAIRVRIVDPDHPHYPEHGEFTGEVISLLGKPMAKVKLEACRHGTDACFVSKGSRGETVAMISPTPEQIRERLAKRVNSCPCAQCEIERALLSLLDQRDAEIQQLKNPINGTCCGHPMARVTVPEDAVVEICWRAPNGAAKFWQIRNRHALGSAGLLKDGSDALDVYADQQANWEYVMRFGERPKPWYMLSSPPIRWPDRIRILLGLPLWVRFNSPDGNCHAACSFQIFVERECPTDQVGGDR